MFYFTAIIWIIKVKHPKCKNNHIKKHNIYVKYPNSNKCKIFFTEIFIKCFNRNSNFHIYFLIFVTKTFYYASLQQLHSYCLLTKQHTAYQCFSAHPGLKHSYGAFPLPVPARLDLPRLAFRSVFHCRQYRHK